MFYLSILIVKDHQTVEPNAKYTCIAKRVYVTDILKPYRTETELLLVGSIPITSLRALSYEISVIMLLLDSHVSLCCGRNK